MRRQVGPRHLSCPRPHHSSRPPPWYLPPSPHISSGTLARRTGVAASSPLNFMSGSGADAGRPEAAGGGVRCRLGAERDGAGARDRTTPLPIARALPHRHASICSCREFSRAASNLRTRCPLLLGSSSAPRHGGECLLVSLFGGV
jgi:hypothetical protein